MARGQAAAVTGLETRLLALWPPDEWSGVTVLAAVSGGTDSVALLRLLHSVRNAGDGRLIVAHYNHGLRPEADDDEKFVCRLSERLGLECYVGRQEGCNGILAGSTGIEEAARKSRYEFLRQAAADCGARYVATAHTADDQAETVLHRILRGTGVAGLAGMRRARPLMEGVTLIRPLLTVRRAELVDYLSALDQPFCQDATNLERRFTRNRLRHELLPQLAQQYNSQVVEALSRLGQLAGEAQEVIECQVQALLTRAARLESGQIVIDRAQLLDRPRHLVREMLIAAWRRQGWPEQAMGFDEWQSLTDLLFRTGHGHAGRSQMFPGGIRAELRDDLLLLVADA